MGERPKLAFIDLLNFIGLNTKSSNEVKQDLSVSESLNTDLFRVYGAVSKTFGSTRKLNSVYTEAGTPRKITWIGAWKNTALNGQTDRQVLAAAGTKLHRLETAGTLTALTGTGKNVTEDWVEGLYHVADKANDLLFITNRNPDLIGNGNTLVKYDGNEISRWGLRYPSTEPSVEKRVTGIGATPPTGPNDSWIPTNGTVVEDTVTTQDGNALSLTKTSAAATNAYIERTFGANPLIGHNKHFAAAEVWVFIPLGELVKLADSNALNIRMGSNSQLSAGITIPDFSTGFYEWDIPIGELFEGWNLIQLGFSETETDLAFDEHLTIFGAPTITNLKSIRLGFNSRTNATLPAGIRFSQLRSFYRGNVDTAEGSAGAVFTDDSVYSYKVTFVSKQALESNAGPKSTDLTLTAGRASIELTNIPTSTDPQVTGRRLYRTVAGGSVWLFLDSIHDNTTTTYSDVTDDDGLGEETPPEAGDNSIDHTPPPPIAMCKFWEHTMFGAGDASNPNTVFWSDVDEPEAWPQLNVAVLDAKITAIYEAYSALIIETELGKWQVIGENPDFKFNKIITNIGCIGRRAAGETRLQGWAIDRDGVRVYDANNPSKISEPIRDKFDGFNKENIEVSHSVHSKNNNCVLVCMAGSTRYSFNADNYIYQYPVDEVGMGWWWQLSLPTSVNILDLEEIEDSNGDFHVYFGGDDGMIYELFDRDAKSWATATSEEAITTRFKTKWLRLGQLGENTDQVSGRVAPRFIEAIVDGDPCTWNITIETATGPNQEDATDSTTVDLVFGDTNEKLMRYPVPHDLQPGEYIRITAEQDTIDKDSRLLSMRLYFAVKPGQFAIETGTFNADL